MHPPQDPRSPSGTPTRGPSAHHPPEEGERGGEEQDQDQPRVLGPLVQVLALLLCNLGEGKRRIFGSAPRGPAPGGDEVPGAAPAEPRLRLPAHLLGAEARWGFGLLEEPHPSPDGDEDVGQVEQEGRAEVGAVFPWGRRARGRHGGAPGTRHRLPTACPQGSTVLLCPRGKRLGANPPERRGDGGQTGGISEGWVSPASPSSWQSRAPLRTPVPIMFPSRKTTMLIIREPSQKRPKFL